MEMSRDFDPAALERVRAMGGPMLVKRLVQLVLESTPQRVSDARRCAGAGDLAGAAFAAHALRSSAGNAGATRVYHIAGDLEREARAGHSEQASVLVNELEAAASIMQAALTRMIMEQAT